MLVSILSARSIVVKRARLVPALIEADTKHMTKQLIICIMILTSETKRRYGILRACNGGFQGKDSLRKPHLGPT